MPTADIPAEASLGENVHADVCIIGAGIAGMSTAYMLGLAGTSVIVVDDGPIAGGETCRTTAHLSTALDDRYCALERTHGERGARLAAASHAAAIDTIEQIVNAERIECDFQRLDGYLVVPPGEPTEPLDQELRAAHRAGLADIESVARVPYHAYEFGAALRFPRQGQLHALKYMAGLAAAIRRRGAAVYTKTRVVKVAGGDRAVVETSEGHRITADTVVVATNTPVNDLVAIHTKQAPYRTYVIGARVAHGSVPTMLLWDTSDPYHYVRTHTVKDAQGHATHDVLIVGGEDHKTGQARDLDTCLRRLEDWMRERFPMAGEIVFRWSGQVLEPVDGLGFIGRNPMDSANVLIATGASGSGMTYGTIAGSLLADLIAGRENEWAALYDPSRISLRTAGRFMHENLNVAAQFSDLVTGGDVEGSGEIAPGEGAIIRRGLSKVAVYRDEGGALHEHAAACPHLGCIVAWNAFEKSWDCPCHGSRFDKCDGHPLNGPAIAGLSRV
jgi:glycine/D-amino acid oxidase-like deaminating enzyme/nitrite reductase/ring-hydroxylating ferredoxin subunit